MSKYFFLMVACWVGLSLPTPAGAKSAQWSGTGVMTHSGGEMHLFTDPKKVGVFPNHCVTLAAPSRAALRAFTKHNGKMVRVKGTAIAWPGGTTISIKLRGETIRNVCNSNFVVLAASITELR